jgi:hypothetical protein
MPLRIVPIRFVLRSLGLDFPAFSGSAWHGGLGMVLSRHAPAAFRRLYQTDSASRLYAIHPDPKLHSPVGEYFELNVTLFGTGVDHALAITQAVTELGRVGLRPGGHFELHTASVISPQGEVVFLSEKAGFIALPPAFAVSDYLNATPEDIASCQIHFTTPLRIKEGNDVLCSAPRCDQLLHRIFSRLDQLAFIAEAAPPLPKDQRAELLAEAQDITLTHTHLSPKVLERRSARSGQQMKLEGFVGTVEYAGDMRRVLPWLKLAQLTQVGGKTAFGFGGLAVISPV